MKIRYNRMNKVGGDKIISVYWFAILFLVAAAIAYMVFAFYGQVKDIRSLEADALTNRVAECISYAGRLNSDVLFNIENFKSNFLEECHINFEVEDEYGWKEEVQYYIEVKVSDFNTGIETFAAREGNANLKSYCGLSGTKSPFCLERNFYTLDSDGKQYKVNILSIVRKTEKNAK